MKVILGMALTALLLLPAPAVLAQHRGHTADSTTMSPGLVVAAPWARASAGMAKTGAAYLTLTNAGAASDRLVAASSPIAGRVELHTHIREGDVMRMRPVDAIEIAAGGRTELKPGGLHIMLMDLKAPLKQGDSFPLTLQFERAGAQTVSVSIQGVGASGPDEHGGHTMAPPQPRNDQEAIRALMMATFDRPEDRLKVEPVVIRGERAVAGWVQGDQGGRALLDKGEHGWRLILCSGDALRDAKFLQDTGMSRREATALADAVKKAESRMAKDTLAMFARFDGVVRMDEHGNHPPSHGPAHGPNSAARNH